MHPPIKLSGWSAPESVARKIAQTSAPGEPFLSGSVMDTAAVFRRHVSVWESGRIGELSSIIDKSYVGHTSSGDRDQEGLGLRIENFHSLYSCIKFSILDQLVAIDRVATRLECTAVENLTRKPVHMWGMNLSVVRQRMIIEEWAVWEISYEKVN